MLNHMASFFILTEEDSDVDQCRSKRYTNPNFDLEEGCRAGRFVFLAFEATKEVCIVCLALFAPDSFTTIPEN